MTQTYGTGSVNGSVKGVCLKPIIRLILTTQFKII